MVWGLVEPTSYGDFFQGGDFVGWDETLKLYFDRNMSSDEKSLYGDRSAVYEAEVTRKFSEDRGALGPHEMPPEFQLRYARKSLGSLTLLSDRLVVVDEGLKEIIEAADPGVHQFWPLRIVTPKRDAIPMRYFGFVIRRFIDSLIPEQGGVHQVSAGSDTYFGDIPTKMGYAAITLSREKFNGAPIWRERRLKMPSIFFSDDLQSEITRQGLRIPRHHQLATI